MRKIEKRLCDGCGSELVRTGQVIIFAFKTQEKWVCSKCGQMHFIDKESFYSEPNNFNKC